MSSITVPLPYIDVVGTPASPNTDLAVTVQIHIDGYAEGTGVDEGDLVDAVKDYLSGIVGADYPINTIVATKHSQTDTVL